MAYSQIFCCCLLFWEPDVYLRYPVWGFDLQIKKLYARQKPSTNGGGVPKAPPPGKALMAIAGGWSKESHFSVGVWLMLGCHRSSGCPHTHVYMSSINWTRWLLSYKENRMWSWRVVYWASLGDVGEKQWGWIYSKYFIFKCEIFQVISKNYLNDKEVIICCGILF